jgi:hypothetical protein
LLLSLLTSQDQTTGAAQPTPPLDLPPTPPASAFEPRLLPALIFWGCMFALAGYAIWTVVQRHPGVISAMTSRGPLAWLLGRLGLFWRDTRSWAGQATQQLQTLLRRSVAAPQLRMPALRLSRLAPRELVRYFYRSTLRRAAAGGLPRRSAQTPYEYSATFAERLPEARQDIVELTEVFVVAEYSPRPVGPEQARRARRPWERVRRRLRTLRAERQPPDEGKR